MILLFTAFRFLATFLNMECSRACCSELDTVAEYLAQQQDIALVLWLKVQNHGYTFCILCVSFCKCLLDSKRNVLCCFFLKPQPNSKYKTSMCRDLRQQGGCPRGTNCTFAHSQEELEKWVWETFFWCFFFSFLI